MFPWKAAGDFKTGRKAMRKSKILDIAQPTKFFFSIRAAFTLAKNATQSPAQFAVIVT